ncbi:MAG TPA: trypsin-like peptidase domain-containing protein [Candidatus Saccharimonadales bacterium]|nr:trypsin-like peptidase domain-containing protein [Candidatus Saccharimonadales bacterium]
MHRLFLVTFSLLAVFPGWAREGTPPLSRRRPVRPLAGVRQLALPPTNPQFELASDAARGPGTPLRFANSTAVIVTPATHGTWEQLPEGRLWRLRITSPGATDLNFGFSEFWLPEGATLHVLSEDEAYFQGPYTAGDNKPHGELWTPVVPGESGCIELFIPAQTAEEPRLVLSQIGLGYRDLFHRRQDLFQPAAESCEIDVACPQAAGWSNEIRSVARYSISGSTLCTGTLIADAPGDLRNYFLTANHCGLNAANAASVVVYWNYQSPTCGQLGGGSLAQNQNGAMFRAAKTDVDFALIELEDVPDSSFQVFYSGWDRSGTQPGGIVGIHHPNGDEKAISFSTTPPTTVSSCIGSGGSATHWQVIWNAGVTEPGSSGSGIWNPSTHRLVGTLSGGTSDCTKPSSPDCYGKLAVAWASGSSAGTRLSDWLDPQNTGLISLAGMDPSQRIILLPAGSSLVTESCPNNAVDPGETITVNFSVRNTGGITATSLVAVLQSSGGVIAPGGPQDYGTFEAGGAAVSRPFTFTASGSCGGTLRPVLDFRSGTNPLGTVTFSLPLGKPTSALSEDFDDTALPAGWSATLSGAGTPWAVSTAQSDTPPGALFAPDVAGVSDNQIRSPLISIRSANARLTFRHRYDLESSLTSGAGFDGGVLEMSIDGGAFVDVLAAGASFTTGGYNATLSTRYRNPLAGRPAWSGNSEGFVSSAVSFPGSVAGHTVRLAWRLGCDRDTAGIGWYVDSVVISDGDTCCQPLVLPTISNARQSGAGFMFSYGSVNGQSYIVEAKSELNALPWIPIRTNAGDGSVQWFTNATAGAPQRFFRLRTQ